jgi:hypothetical protein
MDNIEEGIPAKGIPSFIYIKAVLCINARHSPL